MFKKISQFLDSLMLRDILVGMAITGRYLFKPKITVQYPEEKTPQSVRFRGLHALRRYENAIDNQMDWLNAQNVVLDTELSLAELEYGKQIAGVLLIRSLGGGYHVNN